MIRFAHARPTTDASAPARWNFEQYFAVSDPATAAWQNLTVYPRVSEIVDTSTERAYQLACESRPLHSRALRCKVFFVGDDQDFCNARFVNPDFSKISNSKTILKGVDREKSAVFKELTQSFRTYELRGQAKTNKKKKKANRIKDKQVPHTVLQKLL